jgi:signal transduction histidine kinase
LCRASIEEMQETLGMRHLLLFEMKGAVQTVTADKKLLERVLINLLSNAIKYSAPGTTICLTLSQERDQAVIRIIDQGWGIAPADLELLFTPYFRTDEAQGVSGVGLGLSIVRECVARHHGRIAVQSELDQGTTFTIYLPLRQQIDPDNGLTP